MGRQSRKRAIRRLSRCAAVQSTARHWFRVGLSDVATYGHLAALEPERLLQVQNHALAIARRPRHADYAAAHMTLGALARLLHTRAEEAAVSG